MSKSILKESVKREVVTEWRKEHDAQTPPVVQATLTAYESGDADFHGLFVGALVLLVVAVLIDAGTYNQFVVRPDLSRLL